MSNDLVVQLGAKLDQFSSDMNQAGDMADSAVSRIESSFANLNPGLGGFGALGLSITGATGAIGGLLAALSSVNSQLADIQKNADFSGISTDRLQQLQFAAGQNGIGNDQSATDLANVSKLLADANYNENSLTKLLDENNIKYKDRNGEVITLNQLLALGPGLLSKFDSIPDKTKAAQMLGLSQGWVQAWHDGGDAFEALAQKATDSGAIIDSQTIAKAALFDQAWKASSAQLGAQFKSVVADIAVYLDGLIDKANGFIASLNLSQGIAAGSGQTKFDTIADSLDIVRKDSIGAAQDVAQLTRVIDQMNASGTGDPQIVAGLEEIRAKAQLAAAMIQQVNEQQSKAAFPNGVPTPTARPAAANAKTGTGSLPERGGAGADPIQDAINSLQKHTLATQADADAVGAGAAALAGFKVDAAETAAVLKSGKPETDAQSDAFGDLRDQAVAASDALAKAKVASDISRGSQTALFTPQDLAIANQLKGIYGDDIPAAMASSQAAALKFNSTIQQLGQLGQQVNSGFLVDFETQIRNGATAMQALQTAGVNALGKIADKLASMAADNLWASAFGGSTGGAGSFFSSIFGGGKASNATDGIGGFGPTAPVVTAAVGGFITGPGTSTSDSIPARLSNGEYVINAAAASKYKSLLDSINSGKGYASGGPVGNVIPSDVMPSGDGTGITVHTGSPITIQGNADQTTLSLMQQALAKRDAELPSKVIQAVTLAQKQRKLK